MRHLDLFSGIGGFALAASWVWGKDHKILSFCEIEKFPQKVLKKHWPDVPCHDDIKTMKGDKYGRVDILTGGFPCQPYSEAGKQRGKSDNRALWPEMFRIIKEAKPRWIIGENVDGFIYMGLDTALSDLESEGYETTAFILPACSVNAQHKRSRIWIVANAKGAGKSKMFCKSRLSAQLGGSNWFCWRYWSNEPGVGRVVDGIPNRVDRLKGLGNAIVPQVVVPIMEAIKRIDS